MGFVNDGPWANFETEAPDTLENGSVGTNQLVDLSVTTQKLANGSVTTGKLSSVLRLSSMRTFDTVAAMQAATDLEAGMTCHTNGFHSAGDGGEAYYTISTSGTANGMDVLNCANSLKAVLLVTEPYVTPEQYGAYGDGVHDDTDYIRYCIANNPSAKIAFSSKQYNITDEVMCFGSLGGQDIDLGGATIRFTGVTPKPVFSFYDKSDVESSSYLYSYYQSVPSTEVSKAYIHGGTIIGGACAIQNSAYHTMISDVKIENSTRAGIILGNDNFIKSLQTSVSNVLIMRNEEVTYWSEEISERNIDLDEAPCGILLLSPDNLLINITINRYPVSVHTVYDGQVFTNCHFIAQYRTARENFAYTVGVLHNPPTTTRTGMMQFNSIYFDNHQWCFYTTTESRTFIQLEGSYYFNSGAEFTDIEQVVYAFMANANTWINVSNFNVRPTPSWMTFIPAGLLYWDYNKHSIQKETYNHTFYTGGNELFNANNLMASGDSALVLKSSTSMESGQELAIGCIAIPGGNASRSDSFDISINFRNSLVYRGTVRLTSSAATFDTDFCHVGISSEAFKLAIGEFETVTINNYNISVAKIYIVPVRTVSNVPMYVSVDRGSTNTLVFMTYGAPQVSNEISTKIGTLTFEETPYHA